ncbi:MAG: hypothetical protein ACK4PN_08355 [Allorhizobium sp.]
MSLTRVPLQMQAGASLSFQHPVISSPPIVTSMQQLWAEGLSLRMCASGPVGDGSDCTAAMQKLATECAVHGFTGRIGRGDFVLSGTVVFDEAGATAVDAKRGGLVGEGPGSTFLRSAFTGAAIRLVGGASPGIALHGRFGDFLLIRDGLAKNGIGLQIDNYAWSDFERIGIYGFDNGMLATDFLTSTLRRVTVRNNRRGLQFSYSDFSRPNALTFHDLELGMNSEFGALISEPATLSWLGGAVEGNGIGGTGEFGFRGGVALINGGTEGAVGSTIGGVYFEYNSGNADLRIDHSSNEAVYALRANTFNRISSADFVTNNIVVAASEAANVIVDISACAFKGFNSYVEAAERPYILNDTPANAKVVVDDATLFKSDLAYVDPARWGAAQRGGSVASTGVATKLPRKWTSLKSSVGVYVVTHNLNTLDYAVTADTNSASGNRVERVLQGLNSFTVVVTNAAGVAADDAFMFTMRRG